MARKPANSSVTKGSLAFGSAEPPASDCDGWLGAVTCTPATSAADQTKVSALKTNTTCISVTTSRSPPMAGPTKKATLSSVLTVPFAAVSSAGSRARAGSIADSDGRKGEPAMDASVARMNTVQAGASVATSAAATDTSTARDRSDPIITYLRGSRSASIAANGVTKLKSPSLATPQTPTAVAPPTPYAQTATAVLYAQSPISEPANARLIRRRPGFLNTVESDPEVSRMASPTCAMCPLFRPPLGKPKRPPPTVGDHATLVEINPSISLCHAEAPSDAYVSRAEVSWTSASVVRPRPSNHRPSASWVWARSGAAP